MGDTCGQSVMVRCTIIRLLICMLINCLRLFVFASFVTMAMVVMGGMCVSRPYALLSGYYVGNSLRLFVFVNGDGSEERHMCTKYHGLTHYYQQLIGYVVYSLRIFVIGIAMAMVVVGHICTENIMVVHNTI